MAKKVLGPTMLKMFEEEVTRMFGDLLTQSRSFEADMEREIDITARKELGIYDLSVQIAEMEMKLGELKRQMQQFTTNQRIHGDWTNQLEVKKAEVRRRLMHGSLTQKIREEKARIIREVRIASLGEDIAVILREEVPKTIEALTKEVAALPKPNAKELPIFEDDYDN